MAIIYPMKIQILEIILVIKKFKILFLLLGFQKV